MTQEHGAHATFSANKIFVTLFILTAVEVAWSLVFRGAPLFVKWGGLMAFASWKGLLIYMYFMHMKFEGWIVKALIAPTPILIAVVVFGLLPDVGTNEQLIYKVGSQLDKTGQFPGQVVGMIEPPKPEHEKPEEKKD